jgi:rod shape-determining protein MreC
MFSDYHYQILSPLREALSFVITPLQYLVNFPIEIGGWVQKTTKTRNELLQENTKLQNEQQLLQERVQRVEFLEQENNQLKALLSASKRIEGKVAAAQLLTVDVSNLKQEVVIDKGKNDGLYIGQPVLDAYGVLGQVVKVDVASSRVLLITDPKNAIPVINVRTGVRTIVTGVGETNFLELVHVSDTMDIKVGDLLVTSGLGFKLPEGYPVGKVKMVYRVMGEKFARVVVSPSAHVDKGRYLLLVWPTRMISVENKAVSHGAVVKPEKVKTNKKKHR